MERQPKMTSAVATVRTMAFSPLAPPVGPGLHHLGGGHRVGAQGDDLVFFPVDLFQTLDERRADAAALAVDNADAHWLRPLL